MERPMKILGVHPGPLMYTKIFLRLEPLGLELIAAVAREAGHEVRLIDLQVESHRDLLRLTGKWRPDVIAFSCNYLANIPVDFPPGAGGFANEPRHPRREGWRRGEPDGASRGSSRRRQ